MQKYIDMILNSELDIDEIRGMFENEVPNGDFEALMNDIVELN